CMVCFDGASVENNRILFCDGCNAALHQRCYGVRRIPDGDFLCDRCQYLQQEEAGGAPMCCLCPLKHGGLKPTTDGRWVHLCCALWSDHAVLLDLGEMGPVDVSRVRVQLPPETELACEHCRLQGGLLAPCAHSAPCSRVFHPLCAWFAGAFVGVQVSPPHTHIPTYPHTHIPTYP
ncbi:PHD-zinc-finger like domain-containing protein, partial [Ochromonadaceae sp. CCMP2298]